MVYKRWYSIVLLMLVMQQISAAWISDFTAWLFPSPSYIPVVTVGATPSITDLTNLPDDVRDLDVRIITVLRQLSEQVHQQQMALEHIEEHIQQQELDTILQKLQHALHKMRHTYAVTIKPYAVFAKDALNDVVAKYSYYAQMHTIKTAFALVTLVSGLVTYRLCVLHDELLNRELWSFWEPAQAINTTCPSDQYIAILLRTIQMRYGLWSESGSVPFQKFYQALERERYALTQYAKYYTLVCSLHLSWLGDSVLYGAIPERLRKIDELKRVWTTLILAKRLNSPYANHSAAENMTTHASHTTLLG